MSLGPRLLPRGKSRLFGAKTNTPSSSAQPLLFLYPRWLQSAAVAPHVRQYAKEPEQKTPTIRLQDGNESSIQSFNSAAEDQHSGVIAARLLPLVKRTDLKQRRPTNDDNSIHISAEKISQLRPRKSQSTRTAASSTLHTPVAARLREDPEYIRRVHSVSPQQLLRTIRASEAKKRFTRSKIERFARDKAQTRTEEGMDTKTSSTLDWRRVMEYLVNGTRSSASYGSREIELDIPARLVSTLLYHPDYNTKALERSFGCKIRLAPSGEEKLPKWIFISGHPDHIDRAAREIFKLCQIPGRRLSVPANYRPDHAQAFLKSANSRPSHKYFRADQLLKPKRWTATSLAHYVKALASMEIPNHHHRRLYPDETHVEQVTRIFHELFTDPKCRSSLSRTAFHDAMRYWSKHNQVSHIQDAISLMDKYGIPLVGESINILLSSFSVRNDPAFFSHVLSLMMERKIPPDSFTWVALMGATSSMSLKLDTFLSMHEHGLLRHLPTLRASIRTFFAELMEWNLLQSRSYKDAIRVLDDKFGLDWLTLPAANEALEMLSKRGQLIDCVGLIEIMISRGIEPDVVSLNSVLGNCKRHSNPPGAIEFHRVMAGFGYGTLDNISYNIMFSMALRRRNFMVARVLWRYACLDEATASRMRYTMQRFYSQSCMDVTAATALVRFWSGAGAATQSDKLLLAGTASSDSLQIEMLPPLESHPCRANAHPKGVNALPAHVDSLSTNGITDLVSLQKHLWEVIALDLDVARQWKPLMPLENLLSLALQIDTEVEKLALDHQSKLDWLNARRVDIPLQHKLRPDVSISWT